METLSLGTLLQCLTTWRPASGQSDPWPTLSEWTHCWQHSLKSQCPRWSQRLVWLYLHLKGICLIACQMISISSVCSSLPRLCFWSCVCYQRSGWAAVWEHSCWSFYCLNKVCFIMCSWTRLCLGHTTFRVK